MVFGKELFFGFNALWIQGNTVYRAHLLALGLVIVADALGTFVWVDDVNLFPGEMALLGHSGSQTSQLMQSSVIIKAMSSPQNKLGYGVGQTASAWFYPVIMPLFPL